MSRRIMHHCTCGDALVPSSRAGFNVLQPSWFQSRSPLLPTVTRYPVESSLSLKENFIFFLKGSDGFLLAGKQRKKVSVIGSSLKLPVHRDTPLGAIQGAKMVPLLPLISYVTQFIMLGFRLPNCKMGMNIFSFLPLNKH